MIVESVRVLSFRNLADGEVSLGPGLNLLWGANGAGKTNLLEATYMALAGRSCRTRDDREAIAFGKSLCRTEARVGAGADRHRIFLTSISRADGRRHLIDGTAASAESSRLRPALSVFMPDRLSLVKGPPSERRAHLDGFCGALWPSRDDIRRRYSRALAQRNALLGRIRSGVAGQSTLDAWETELGEAGVELIALRRDAVARLSDPFSAAAGSLGLGSASVAYRPRSEASDPVALALEIAERRESDLSRGYTGHGPHLDELAFERDRRSIRRYGSQGQQRTALLALLFAERRVLIDDGRPLPLMLLDDVTSELDAQRRGLLVEHLQGGGQAIVTATEPDHLPSLERRRDIAVRDGHALSAAPESEAA